MKYLSTANTSDLSRLSSKGFPVATTTSCGAVGDVFDIRNRSASPATSTSAARPSSTVQTPATANATAATTSLRSRGGLRVDTI